MRYEFSQTSGNSTRLVILEDVVIKDGTVYGTQVGKLAYFDDETREPIYAACPPVEFIAGGGPWEMTKYTANLQ